jgi:hypothetical protein
MRLKNDIEHAGVVKLSEKLLIFLQIFQKIKFFENNFFVIDKSINDKNVTAIGPAHIGHCSQLVVFLRKDFDEASKNGAFAQITLEEDDQLALSRTFVQAGDHGVYKLKTTQKYPVRRETRSREAKILDEAHYYMYMMAHGSDEWIESVPAPVALRDLMAFDKIQKHDLDLAEFRYK